MSFERIISKKISPVIKKYSRDRVSLSCRLLKYRGRVSQVITNLSFLIFIKRNARPGAHLHLIVPGQFLRSHVTLTVIVNFLLLWQLAAFHFESADEA